MNFTIIVCFMDGSFLLELAPIWFSQGNEGASFKILYIVCYIGFNVTHKFNTWGPYCLYQIVGQLVVLVLLIRY